MESSKSINGKNNTFADNNVVIEEVNKVNLIDKKDKEIKKPVYIPIDPLKEDPFFFF